MSKRIIVELRYLRKPGSRPGYYYAPLIFDRLSCNRTMIYLSAADCAEVVDSNVCNKESSVRDVSGKPKHKLVRNNGYWLFETEASR